MLNMGLSLESIFIGAYLGAVKAGATAADSLGIFVAFDGVVSQAAIQPGDPPFVGPRSADCDLAAVRPGDGVTAGIIPARAGFQLTALNPSTVVYGTKHCSDCHVARKTLEALRVPYEWVDLDAHPEQVPDVLAMNGGSHSVPTVLLSDGTVLVEPDESELSAAVHGARATTKR